jgi:hypothetical protein
MDRPTIDLSRGIPKSPEDWEWREYADWLEAVREQASQDYADLLKGYRELLYQVVNKHPDETRHETAKRIIHQHENQDNGPTQAALEARDE